MCRHAAYLGPPCRLDAFLTSPPHSLVVQSHSARELERALICADGYGFGWFNPDGSGGRYRSTLAVWQDPNLKYLGETLSRSVWVANVRSATPPLPVSHENTHPFLDGDLLFSHNGYIEQMRESVRPRIRAVVSPAIEAAIHGSTDSEQLFALVRHEWDRGGHNLATAVRRAIATLAEMVPDGADALLNVIAATPDRLVATRHAIGGRRSPSLHVSSGHATFPGGRLVASEPLDSDSSWQSVPEGSLIEITAAGVEVQPL